MEWVETIKTAEWDYVRLYMYGCRLKFVSVGLSCGLSRTPALSVTHSGAGKAYAACGAM